MLPHLLMYALSLVLLSLCCLVYLYLKWNFNYWKQRGVSGPKPYILSGTFAKTYGGVCNLIEELHEIYLKFKDDQSFVGVYSARSPKLFILDPIVVVEILTKNFKNFRDNESSLWTSPQVEQLRFCSPFVSTGDAWKEKRSELVQALTTNRLRSCYDTMRASAQNMIDFISNQDPGTVWDAKDLANRFTCNVMTKFIWGLEEDTFEDMDKRSTIHQMAETMLNQAIRCVHYYGRTAAWPWLRKLRPVRFFPAVSDQFFKRLVTDAVQKRKGCSRMETDMINRLLQLKEKKKLNDEQIAGHTTTVLIDGFETAAIVIAHCLLMLARNPRVQNKLRAILKAAGKFASYDEHIEAEYLDQCIQETLRLFPPLATLFKMCTEPLDVENYLNGTQVTLNPGDVIYISAYSFHRDPTYYDTPEEYWPERFDAQLGGVQKYRDMGVFLPFGDGPRMCPGMKLGLLEVKIAISELIREFEFIPLPNTRKDNKVAANSFLLRLDGDIQLNIRRIKTGL